MSRINLFVLCIFALMAGMLSFAASDNEQINQENYLQELSQKNHSLDAITIDAGVLDQKSCTPGTVGFGPWTGYFWDKDHELCYATISNSWDTLRIYMDKEYRFVDIKRVINKTVDNGKTWTNELIDWEKEK